MTFQWNNINFKISTLAENAILVKPITAFLLEDIHKLAFAIQKMEIEAIYDMVVAYDSLVVYFTHLKVPVNKMVQSFQQIQSLKIDLPAANTHQIIVDFEKGLDWREVEKITQLAKSQFIELFTAKEYRVAMLGFIPGFVYLEGLDERLICPRKESPRKLIPKGAVGIGGKQAGIYALASPGGWQIIGETDNELFDAKGMPPTILKALDKVVFLEK